MTVKNTTYTKKTVFVEDYDRNITLDFDFTPTRILYHRDTFCIMLVDISWNSERVLFPQNKTTVLGNLLDPQIGDKYTASGRVEYSEEHGYSIRLTSRAKISEPRTRGEIVAYLTRKLPGVGLKRAEKLYEHFGESVLGQLQREPERIKELGFPGSDKLVEAVKTNLVSGVALDKLSALLATLGLRESLAFELAEQLGDEVYDKVLEDPYRIAEYSPLSWRQADQFYYDQVFRNKSNPDIAAYAGRTSRYRTALKYFLKLKLELTGSLAYQESKLIDAFTSGNFLSRASRFGLTASKPTETQLKLLLSELEQEQEIHILKSVSGERYVYLDQAYQAETLIVQNLKRFTKHGLGGRFRDERSEFISGYERLNGLELATRQQDAVDLLVNNRVSVLTGGPGSGKTTTVKAIKEFVDYLFERSLIEDNSVALLAPTGKASRRLSEVLGLPAQTIHRKLKLKGFGRDEHPTKIEERFVIVDEASMIDVYLFSSLLSSLSDSTNLLVVGDVDQLPSVGAGLVLRDLIDSRIVPTIRLDKVFRQASGSRLITNAHCFKDGILPGSQNGPVFNEPGPNGELSDTYFISTSSSEKTRLKLIQSYRRFKSLGYTDEDILILTPQNKGELGTTALNREIQRSCFTHKEDEPVLIRKRDNSAFYVGDPVIQLVNDYDDWVFNGEIGRVEEVEVNLNGTKSLIVRYPAEDGEDERIVRYSGYRVYDINLAYVITVHKSQGSEAPIVLQVVDDIHRRTLNRSLVYTGYTRTKKHNVLIGQTEALVDALRDTSNLERVSLIRERING